MDKYDQLISHELNLTCIFIFQFNFAVVYQEPDKQVLIERLVKLQRENAKKAEKLDFMEEHAQVLVSELQKKTRLIQNFVMKMPAGALSSESMDQNKVFLVHFLKKIKRIKSS